jgi:ELWxxDGT repeat protein
MSRRNPRSEWTSGRLVEDAMRLCSFAAFTVVSLTSAVAAANPIVIDLLTGPTSHKALGITAGKTTAFVVTTEPGAGTDRLYRTNGRADGTALIETMNASALSGIDTSLIGVSSKGLYFIDPDKNLTFHSGYTGGRAPLGKVTHKEGELVGELSNGKAVLRLVGYTDYDWLWVTDGTEKGSSSIDLGAVNGPDVAATLGGFAYALKRDMAKDPVIVRTDGTTPTTWYTSPGNLKRIPTDIASCGGKLFVSLSDGYVGVAGLFVSDGTKPPSVLVEETGFRAKKFRCAGSKLFFVGTTTASGDEIWVSDGTPSGTHITKDVRPGAASSVSSTAPGKASVVDGRLYFNANDGTHGEEPWTTDGTAAGTILLDDVVAGATGSSCAWLTERGTGTKAYCTTPGKIFEAAGATLVARTQVYTDANVTIPHAVAAAASLGTRVLHAGGVTAVSGSGELVVLDSAAPFGASGGSVVFPATGDPNAPDGGASGSDGGSSGSTDGGPSGGGSSSSSGGASSGVADADDGAGSEDAGGCSVVAPSRTSTSQAALFAVVLSAVLLRTRRRR